MNWLSYKSFVMVLLTAWWLSNSGCSHTPTVKNTPPPLPDTATSDGQAPLSSRENPVDVETFSAFCDRA